MIIGQVDEHAHLQQLEGGGGVVEAFQLDLGPRVVEDGREGEVAKDAPVTADDEQGAEDGEEDGGEDGKDDVKEVEPDDEGEELAASDQEVLALLGQVGVVKHSSSFSVKACSNLL